jgi:hypothetical protein
MAEDPSYGLIKYFSKFDEYYLTLPRARGVMVLRFCPWCGKKLPDSRRQQWMDEMDKLNIPDPLFSEAIPRVYQSDEWYREE